MHLWSRCCSDVSCAAVYAETFMWGVRGWFTWWYLLIKEAALARAVLFMHALWVEVEEISFSPSTLLSNFITSARTQEIFLFYFLLKLLLAPRARWDVLLYFRMMRRRWSGSFLEEISFMIACFRVLMQCWNNFTRKLTTWAFPVSLSDG